MRSFSNLGDSLSSMPAPVLSSSVAYCVEIDTARDFFFEFEVAISTLIGSASSIDIKKEVW